LNVSQEAVIERELFIVVAQSAHCVPSQRCMARRTRSPKGQKLSGNEVSCWHSEVSSPPMLVKRIRGHRDTPPGIFFTRRSSRFRPRLRGHVLALMGFRRSELGCHIAPRGWQVGAAWCVVLLAWRWRWRWRWSWSACAQVCVLALVGALLGDSLGGAIFCVCLGGFFDTTA